MGLFKRPECIGNIEILPVRENDWRIDSAISARLTSIALIHYFENILRNPFKEISRNFIYEIIIRIDKETVGKAKSSQDLEFWISYADKLYKSFEEATTNIFLAIPWNQKFKATLKLFKRKRKDSPLGYWYFVQNKITVLPSHEDNLVHRFYSFLALYKHCRSFNDESINDFITISLAHLLRWYKKNGIPTWNELTVSGNMAMFRYFGYGMLSNEIVKNDFEKYMEGQKIDLYALRIH